MEFRLSRRKSRKSDLGVWNYPECLWGGSIEGRSFGVLKNDLLTSTAINDKLPEALKHLYTIVYREDHLSWGGGGFFVSENVFGKFRRGKRIIEEGLDWRPLDRMSRYDIFTTRF